MGKPESGPPSGQSVEQLLTTIRQAIEADGNAVPAASPQPAPGAAAAAPLRVSVKPAAGQAPPAPPAPPAPGPLAPGPDDEKPPAEPRDARRGPGYLSANPYRFRYSPEGSPTYMNLRNRLTSLGQRARADSQRSMASLLGGDARREEARAHAAVQPEPPQPQAELRRSLGDAEDRVDEFVAAELASGTVSYSPDYHEWSLDQSLDAYEFHRSDAAGADDLQQAEPPQPEPAYVEPEPEPAPVYEPEPAPEPELVYHEPEAEPAPEPEPDPEPEAQPQAQSAALQDGAQLQLEGMIRQIIEPELYRWFDEHLPDHVARAMPDEAAFIAMIRPLIEEWLADNLAGIVEDAVRDEIARITGLKPR
jgi:hypothetical protein